MPLELPSDLAITASVFNVADRDPPAGLQLRSVLGNPIGRVFKLGLSKQLG